MPQFEIRKQIRIGWHARGDSLSERIQNVSIESSNHAISGDKVVHENALRVLKRGTCLFKVGSNSGTGHFRRFVLSSDNSQIIWFSAKKSQSACTSKLSRLFFNFSKVFSKSVPIGSITEIIYGQNTETFERLGLPQLSDTSFTIVYARGTKSVNVIAKSERIFSIWTKSLEHLSVLAQSRSKVLSELNGNLPHGCDRSEQCLPELHFDIPDKNKVHPFSAFIRQGRFLSKETSLKNLESQYHKLEAALKRMNEKRVAKHIVASPFYTNVNFFISKLSDKLHIAGQYLMAESLQDAEDEIWFCQQDIEALDEMLRCIAFWKQE
jgi:hypothetical protein